MHRAASVRWLTGPIQWQLSSVKIWELEYFSGLIYRLISPFIRNYLPPNVYQWPLRRTQLQLYLHGDFLHSFASMRICGMLYVTRQVLGNAIERMRRGALQIFKEQRRAEIHINAAQILLTDYKTGLGVKGSVFYWFVVLRLMVTFKRLSVQCVYIVV